MITIRYTSRLMDLIEGLGDNPLGPLDDFLDHGDSLGAFLAEAGALAPLSVSATSTTLGSPNYRLEIFRGGDDLLELREAGRRGETILELARLFDGGDAVGIEATSGGQSLRLEGELPDTHDEIINLLTALAVPNPDLGGLIEPYGIERITALTTEAGEEVTVLDALFAADAISVEFLGYNLDLSLPGLEEGALADLAETLIGAFTGALGPRALRTALAELPDGRLVLTDPEDETLLAIRGTPEDLLSPGKIRLHFTGDGGADEFLGGAGRDTALGRGGADELRGFGRGDVLDGGGGGDLLIGGRGNDEITTGRGADEIRFNRGDGDDVITDFRRVDTLALNDNLWRPELTARQVVNRFAEVTDDGVLFDFGRKGSVLLEGLDSLSGLPRDVDIF